MDSLVVAPVQIAQPHAIPFRTIFEEHVRREQPDFKKALADLFKFSKSEDLVMNLEAAICRHEAAYMALNTAYENIETDPQPKESIQNLEEECTNSDRRLKKLLHKTNANAVCLSGGGIRSASFCLGVLEGLARFSRNKKVIVHTPPADESNLTTPATPDPPSRDGLLDRLDYLSTVSGGGYIGSWLMSWTYRKMIADRPHPSVAEALDRTQDCIERAQAFALSAKATQKKSDLADRAWSMSRSVGKALENANMAIQIMKKNPSEVYQSAAAMAVKELKYADVFREMRNGEEILAHGIPIKECKAILTHLESAAAAIRSATHPNWKEAYGQVVDALAASGHKADKKSFVTGGDPEPQPVRHLRSYTSFLAPELGATLDTSTLAAIIMRNLVVNWAMLLPVLFAAVSLFRFSSFLLEWARDFIMNQHSSLSRPIAVVVAILFLLAAFTASKSLPSHSAVAGWMRVRNRPGLLFISPVFLGCWILAASNANIFCGTFVIALVAFGLLGYSIFKTYRTRVTGRMLSWGRGTKRVSWIIVLIVASCALMTSRLLEVLEKKIYPWLLSHTVVLPGAVSTARNQTDAAKWMFVVFAVPLVMLTLMSSCSMFCAMLGIYEMEEDREWWVRAGGWLLLLNLLWIVGHALTLWGFGIQKALFTGLTGLAVGAIASLTGFSGATSAGTRPIKTAQLSTLGKFLGKHNLVLPAVSLLAVMLIAIGIIALEEEVRGAVVATWPLQPNWMPGHWSLPLQTHNVLGLESTFVVLLISSGFAVLMNLMININLFSLQGMYRMRLMRAFLGASNTFRRENPFTHFDPTDTPLETDLPSAPGAPLHLINTTLNLVGTKNPSWLQRKAESFTFSPIHAGSWRLGYVPASFYGGSRGVTLATAMAISGAAFNPNMGYQSSPLLSLLMTFFNLRLGYWLPNPKRPNSGRPKAARNEDFFSKSGPSFALIPLLGELLGKTDDDSRWIELTDGGHFENLGLYEMVLRRVKQIIVVDAGADPNCRFEDLGNAIRKIQIDLGIPIEFEGRPDRIEKGNLRMVENANLKNRYCAVARIRYQCVDGPLEEMENDELDGSLVYIKASLTGREPMDVTQYAKSHESFPHESTANQFFNEPQFESYRKLGSFILKTIEEQAELSASIATSKHHKACKTAKAKHRDPPKPPATTPYEAFLAGARAQWNREDI